MDNQSLEPIAPTPEPAQQPSIDPALASAPVQSASSFPSSGTPTFEPEQPVSPQDDGTPRKKMSKKTKIIIAVVVAVCLLPPLALVIIMSSVALPNMQTAQRDTQRRNDYSQLFTNITSYIAKNNGSLPNTGTLDSEKYMTNIDPSGNPYSITVIECNSANNCPGKPALNAGEVYVVKNAKCDNGALVANDSKRSFAVWGYLETGKTTRYFCSASS